MTVRRFGHEIEIPQADVAEAAILGAVLLENDLIWDAVASVQPADFRGERHRLIYRAAIELAEAGHPIDPITVLRQLARSPDRLAAEILGSEISALIDVMPRVASLDAYTSAVREAATARRLQVATGGLLGLANDAELSSSERRERAYQMLDEAFGPPDQKGVATLAEALEEGMTALERTREARDGWGTVGIATGLPTVDRLLGGLQPKLYVLAGRPSVGKSALMSQLCLNAVMQDRRVLVLSTEMQRSEIALRFAASHGGVDSQSINSARFRSDEWARIQDFRQWAATLGDRLLIDHTSGPTPADIRARASQVKRSGGLDLIAIDYLQILGSDSRTTNETERVTRLSNQIKQLQQALGIPVLLLSQLSRSSAAEKRAPQLHDLRQSGAIEQDADVVMMLWADQSEGDEGDGRRIELAIRKHRGGRLGERSLRFHGSRFEFTEDVYV